MSAPQPGPRVRLGQHYLPAWDSFLADFDALFERRFFANNGPLVVRLDARFGPFVGARESVAVTNETLAAAIATRALGLTGPVAVPALCSVSLLQGLAWGGAQPVLCDVAADDEGIDAGLLAGDPRPYAALGVVLSPHQPRVPDALQREAARRGVPLLVDGSRALGCLVDGDPPRLGAAVRYHSFHSRHIVNGGEGASIVTDDPELAERLRYCRSFHAASATARVMPRINGKMAEAPAALIHRGLDELEARIARNRALFLRYAELLAGAPLRVLAPSAEVRSNHEALEVELAGPEPAAWAERAVRALGAVGIEAARPFTPRELTVALARPSEGPSRCDANVDPSRCDANVDPSRCDAKINPSRCDANVGPWPVAEARALRRLELPLGAGVTTEDIGEVCALVLGALDPHHAHAQCNT
ncbi:MAG: DegT/DnrJ/EryC1/StrS family aminotransferase [Planctomycetota bacterium]